jgi:hypothetical protein
MRYEAIPQPGGHDIEEALSRGDLAELRLIPLSVSLHSENPQQAERVCLRLAGHGDGITRGNSVLGLGHIARIHRTLTEGVARPVVEAALRDPDEWVRGQAASAADDLEHYLGWKLDRP